MLRLRWETYAEWGYLYPIQTIRHILATRPDQSLGYAFWYSGIGNEKCVTSGSTSCMFMNSIDSVLMSFIVLFIWLLVKASCTSAWGIVALHCRCIGKVGLPKLSSLFPISQLMTTQLPVLTSNLTLFEIGSDTCYLIEVSIQTKAREVRRKDKTQVVYWISCIL